MKKINNSKKFKIENGYPNFMDAYKNCRDKMADDDTVSRFYCPKTESINIVAGKDKKYHQILETFCMKHFIKFSARSQIVGSNYIDEGVTGYFTKVILAELDLKSDARSGYKAQLACASNLVNIAGSDMVAKEYLQYAHILIRESSKIFSRELRRDKKQSVSMYDDEIFCIMLKSKT